MRNADCQDCPLYLGAHTVCLWGEGPDLATGMVIGQNPGAVEDRTGLPFVGPTGKLLDQLFEQAGLDRSKLYITNAVKCVTDGNSEPSPTSVNACRKYLHEEITAKKPKAILLLGNTALRAVVGRSGITRVRGTVPELHKGFEHACAVIPTFHPAAALRSSKYTPLILEDLRKFKAALDDSYQNLEPTWEYGGKLDTSSKTWAWDLETTGLDPKAPDFEIRMVGIDDGTKVHIFHSLGVERGLQWLVYGIAHGVCLVGQNTTAYDCHVVREVYHTDLRSDDIMLMHYLLNEEGNHNLELMATSYLGVAPWKGEYGTDDIDRLAAYCARDCRYTRELFGRFAAELAAKPRLLRLYQNLLLPAGRRLRDMESKGVYISSERLESAAAAFHNQRRGAADSLTAEWRQHSTADFNPNSSAQIATLLFEHLKLPPQRYTLTGRRSTDEETLQRLKGRHPIVASVLSYREASKLLDAFIEPYRSLRDAAGRIHPAYHLTRAVTGRTSSSGPNIQQLPRDSRLRSCVSAEDGGALIAADLSQIELRLTAFLAQEPAMLAAFARGDDLHNLLAAEITGKDPQEVTPAERTLGKICDFLLLYGGEEWALKENALKVYGLELTLPECRRYYEAFHRRWPGLQEWYLSIFRELSETGQVVSPLGRVRHLPDIYSTDARVRTESLRQAINFKPQSFASDFALIGLLRASEREKRGFPVAFIHDAILWECPADQAESVSRSLKQALEQDVPLTLGSDYGIILNTPIVADVKIGETWS